MAELKHLVGTNCAVHVAREALNDEQFLKTFGVPKEQMNLCDTEDRSSKDYQDYDIDNRTDRQWQEQKRRSEPEARTVYHHPGTDSAVASCRNHHGMFGDSQTKMEIMHGELRPFLRNGESIELAYRANRRNNELNDKRNKEWNKMIKERGRAKFNRDYENIQSVDPSARQSFDDVDDVKNIISDLKANEPAEDPTAVIADIDSPYD